MPRAVETILFWLVSATVEQDASGATGDSSSASKSGGAASKVRVQLVQDALIHRAGLDEPVALPLLTNHRRRALSCALFQHR